MSEDRVDIKCVEVIGGIEYHISRGIIEFFKPEPVPNKYKPSESYRCMWINLGNDDKPRTIREENQGLQKL